MTQAEANDAAHILKSDLIPPLIGSQSGSCPIGHDVTTYAIHVQQAAGFTDTQPHLHTMKF